VGQTLIIEKLPHRRDTTTIEQIFEALSHDWHLIISIGGKCHPKTTNLEVPLNSTLIYLWPAIRRQGIKDEYRRRTRIESRPNPIVRKKMVIVVRVEGLITSRKRELRPLSIIAKVACRNQI